MTKKPKPADRIATIRKHINELIQLEACFQAVRSLLILEMLDIEDRLESKKKPKKKK